MAERNVLLKNVKHPFLVHLHYSFQTSDKLFFVLDFINGGERFSFTSCPKAKQEVRGKPCKLKGFLGDLQATRTSVPIGRFTFYYFSGDNPKCVTFFN
ncbi:hypothetical protein AB205_0031280 [Aquarana catesbeiana]|uniref:Protein kinase domain-containing protein n=1 Tax=Aquarana catesbeiana TaxID=8400 RepID=A0A2G9RYR2_AQUCT|nr:hypothetical protein AB205_0031280 [Aquarana catesbeiana]